MNRWARRHIERLEEGLDEGEVLLGGNRVVLVSASSVATWGKAPATSVATRRLSPHSMRLGFARRLGFPLPGWIFVLGVSSRRVLVWRATPVLAKPGTLAASWPLDEIAAVRALRRVGATRLSIVLTDGAMLVVQALWSRRIADLARAFDHARAR